MEKTIAALDEFFSTIIRMIMSWFSMLSSTRVLAFIATAVALFLQYTGSGFSTWESIAFAVLTALTGVSFMAVKTIRSGSPADTAAKTQVANGGSTPALPQPAAVNTPIVQDQIPKPSVKDVFFKLTDLDRLIYNIQLALKDKGVVSWWNIWSEFYTDMNSVSIKDVPVSYRVGETKNWLDKAVYVLNEAYKEITGGLELPTPADFKTNVHAIILQNEKRRYEDKKNIECSGRVFRMLDYLIGMADDLYDAQEGEALLEPYDPTELEWNDLGVQNSPMVVGRFASSLIPRS